MKSNKKLVPFRLWMEDLEKMKAKVVLDKTNFQKVMELLAKMYIENNEEIMKRVKSIQKDKYARKRRHNSFDEFEIDALYHKISEVSRLAEMEKMFAEIDKEQK